MQSPKLSNDDTDYQIALSRVKELCRTFFSSDANPKLVFHNLSHTEYIFKAVENIANHYRLDLESFFIVATSAYFYNLGFHKDSKYPEEKSAELAEEYLKKLAIPVSIIKDVQSCVLATRESEAPQNLNQEIVYDSVFYFLGTKDFKPKNKLMHSEYELINNTHVNKKEWRKRSIQLLTSHKYYTAYCLQLLNEQKEENLQKIELKDVDIKAGLIDEKNAPCLAITDINGSEIKNVKKIKEERPNKGIETMFRVSSANHLKLSDMADSKAHIMITVNAIIISVLISLLLRKLDTEPQLILPAMLLLTVSLITIVFSILATRPNIPPGTFTKEQLKQKNVDLLFFGNYYKMCLTDYEEGMTKMMGDKDFLYGSLIKDLYGQGVVLGRKYRLLRISYSVFMYGLVAAVIAFVIASVI